MLATSTLAAAPVKASVVSIVDVVRVIDGDTVEIKSDGSLRRLRLLGVDAPEADQSWGTEAVQELKILIEGKRAFLRDSGLKDGYGRALGSLAVDDMDVGLILLEKGLAWHFEPQRQSTLPADWNAAYKLAQEEAKYESVGLWSSSSPVPPWVWRKHQYEIERNKWYSYSESLEGATEELQNTIARFSRVLFDDEASQGQAPASKAPAVDKDNFIEEKEPPTWWQLFIKLGEGISRWISAFFRTSL